MALDEIEVGRYEKIRGNNSETDDDSAITNGLATARTDKDIEVQAENFVFLLTQKGLKKFESHKKEGHLKGPKKSPPNSDLVETGGAAAGALIGAPFGSTGTGASVGASVSKFIYEFSYGQLHRKKAKAIDKAFEKYSLDESQMLDMLSSIGAEIFRVFERQLTLLEVNDLKKVAHDVVVRVYDAIRDSPDILEKEEFERNAVLARSATDHRTFLDEIFRGHSLDSNESWRTKSLLSKVGIYDNGEYFVSDHTDSVKYQFRLPFKNEVINKDIWHVAKEEQIGSFQPKYFITEDMISRIQKKAVSRVIAANLEKSIKQNLEGMKIAATAVNETKIAGEVLFANVADFEAKRKISNMKMENLVQPREKLNAGLADIQTIAAEVREKSEDIVEQLVDVHDTTEKLNVKINELNPQLAVIKEKAVRIASAVQIRKVGESNIAPLVANYFQREKAYEEIKQCFQPENCTKSTRIACIVGKPLVGKSELARSYALNMFQNKYIFWIDATDKESTENSIHEVAERLKIDISKIGDTNTIWQQICSTVTSEDTLIVFDNPATHQDIANYIPGLIVADSLSPKIIVTSRNEEGWENLKVVPPCKVIKLDVFSESECLKFFKDLLKEKGYHVEKPPNGEDDIEVLGDKDEDIIELGSRLDFMPKKLDNALSIILNDWKKSLKRAKKGKRYTLTKYLESLRLDSLS